MKSIPISATPSQKLNSVLGGQNCQLKVYQKTTGLYVDVYVNNAPIVQGAIARDRVRIVRHAYLGFVGDLAFVDTQGTSDPQSTGLGSRYSLIYLEASDL
ncbi:hypothetical protein AX768_09225 [Burkholderia sp. PAMC 28687]|uniref:phage baseplate plug family protein n=1 Tax=Burkholderia sp. PAMC 28687 TaxID=1795874 RepID=UPI000780AC0B|nr:hypothetical protein [Burkholderia sp. PAMC 28687]AMM14250.1 hypothetical protein AX768_09225 [Burkholderia sp. PAMC 28687]